MKKYFLVLTSLAFSTIAIGQQISLTNYNTEVFIENFSSKTPQFIYEKTTDNYFTIDDGDLFMSRNNKLSDFTIFSSIPFNEENYKLKTSIKLISSGSKSTHVGILLNTQIDGNGLISVEFNSNKEYRVRQINNGESKYLSGTRENEGWVADKNLKDNGEFNYIDVLSANGRYDIYFNFKYINTFESPEYTTGRFGFLIGAQSQARIDYVHVHKDGGKVSTLAFNNANNEILKLESQIITLQETINSNQNLLDQLKKENNDFSNELKSKNEKISNLSTKIKTFESNSNNLKIALKESEEAKSAITNEANDFKSAILSYEKSSNSLKEKNSTLLSQLETKINELSNLQTNFSNSKLELNKKLANQNKQLDKSNSDLKIINDQNNSLSTEIKSVNNELIELKKEKKKLNKAIISQDEENKKLKSKISKLNDNISALNVDKEKLNSRLENANSKSDELTKKNFTISQNLLESEKRFVEQENKSKNLSTKLKKAEGDNLKNKGLVTQLNATNKFINDSLNSLFDKYSILLIKEKELGELKEEYTSLSKENQENLSDLDKIQRENDKLKSQLDQQKLIASQFAESYRYELEKSKKFQQEILNYQSELTLESSGKSNTIYKIQLGLFDEEIDVEGLDDLTKIDTENNQFIYLSGGFDSYSLARTYLIKVNELGFNNAFIVKF